MHKIIAALKPRTATFKRSKDAFELRLDKIAIQKRRPIGARQTA